MKNIEKQIVHPLKPIYNSNCKILILGTMPSIKSRENNMYYSNPKNRFWTILANIFNEPLPCSNEEKENFLLNKNIAIWDVLKTCKIKGSSDSSIKDPIANDFNIIFNNCNIKQVFTTGKIAYTLYKKLTNNESICLPSPSSANCAITLEKLIKEYSIILKYL